MKKIILIVGLVPLLAFDGGQKYLEQIPAYQKESYFKKQVYAEHNWKSFFKLAEANAICEPNNYDFHLLSAAFFFATNKLREEKGQKPLTFSGELRDAATVHTSQMIEKKFFDHFNHSNADLRAPDQRIKLFGTNSNAFAENVDMNNVMMPSKQTYLQVVAQLVDDLFHSPEHRKNMLSKDYTHMGCAAMFEGKDKQGIRYMKATQDFAR